MLGDGDDRVSRDNLPHRAYLYRTLELPKHKIIYFYVYKLLIIVTNFMVHHLYWLLRFSERFLRGCWLTFDQKECNVTLYNDVTLVPQRSVQICHRKTNLVPDGRPNWAAVTGPDVGTDWRTIRVEMSNRSNIRSTNSMRGTCKCRFSINFAGYLRVYICNKGEGGNFRYN